MKTAAQIYTELKKMISYPSKESEDMLRKWAVSIVDRCGAELKDDGAIQEGWLYDKIMKIKEQL